MDNVGCDVMFTVQVINFDANWNPENNFTKILYTEIDSLRGSNVEHMGKVLSLYINIKRYISCDIGNPSAIPFAYPSESTLSRKCNYGVSTVKKYTKILCNIKMLYMKNYGSYRRLLKGKEIIENSNNVYALKKEYLDNNAKESLKKYLKANYGYIDGFYPLCNNLPDTIPGEKSDPRNRDVLSSMDTKDDDFSIEEAKEISGTPMQNDSVLEPERSTESEDGFIDIDTFPW